MKKKVNKNCIKQKIKKYNIKENFNKTKNNYEIQKEKKSIFSY